MEQKPERVRWATHADEDAVYSILVELHRFNGSGWNFPFRPEIVLALIEVATRPYFSDEQLKERAKKGIYPVPRTDVNDKRVGVIGVIDGADGKLAGIVGVYILPAMWFSERLVPTELFLFVRPTERDRRHYERDLFQFARWFRDGMATPSTTNDGRLPFPLMTGFMHIDRPGKRPLFAVMDRFWGRASGGKKVGSLFWVE